MFIFLSLRLSFPSALRGTHMVLTLFLMPISSGWAVDEYPFLVRMASAKDPETFHFFFSADVTDHTESCGLITETPAPTLRTKPPL
jgi:hypothetical protein